MKNSYLLWLFFDIGETLLSEKSFHDARNDGLFATLKSYRTELTRSQYEAAHRRAIHSRPEGESSRVRSIAREVLGPDLFYKAVQDYRNKYGSALLEKVEQDANSFFRPYPEVREVLETLSKRYSLGVIANQHRRVRTLLEKNWGLASFFDFMILSEEVGFKKPDREIFLLALDKARIDSSEAWMIGDRVDTDVGPSRSLGMKAIRVLHDSEMAMIEPRSDFEWPDHQFKDLRPLLNIF